MFFTSFLFVIENLKCIFLFLLHALLYSTEHIYPNWTVARLRGSCNLILRIFIELAQWPDPECNWVKIFDQTIFLMTTKRKIGNDSERKSYSLNLAVSQFSSSSPSIMSFQVYLFMKFCLILICWFCYVHSWNIYHLAKFLSNRTWF